MQQEGLERNLECNVPSLFQCDCASRGGLCCRCTYWSPAIEIKFLVGMDVALRTPGVFPPAEDLAFRCCYVNQSRGIISYLLYLGFTIKIQKPN